MLSAGIRNRPNLMSPSPSPLPPPLGGVSGTAFVAVAPEEVRGPAIRRLSPWGMKAAAGESPPDRSNSSSSSSETEERQRQIRRNLITLGMWRCGLAIQVRVFSTRDNLEGKIFAFSFWIPYRPVSPLSS